MKHYCKNCKKPVKNFYATLCLKCYRIYQKNPKNNPMFGIKRPDVVIRNHDKYKGGLPKCIDCGKQLAHYKSKRCTSCRQKGILNNRFGVKESIENKTKRIQKIVKVIHNSPNKLEYFLGSLLPKQYKFVGDGSIFIGGFNPDFVNVKNKKIVELYGDYWHNLVGYKERDKRRLKIYKKLGYKTLIIWEHELKDLNKLNNKILQFN